MLHIDASLYPWLLWLWVIFLPLAFGLVNDLGLKEAAKSTGSGLGGVQFGWQALGTSSTAAANGDTALGAESVASAARVATTNALATTTFTSDTVSLSGTWTFTATFALFEFGIFNASSAGIMLLRQVYAAVFQVVATDVLTQIVSVISSDSVPASASTITRAGIVDGNKLIFSGVGTGTAVGWLGFGTGSTAVADTQTALVTETFANGLGTGSARHASTVTNTTTLTTLDTVHLNKSMAISGTATAREVGIFNAATAGTMYQRNVFAADLSLVINDTLIFNSDYQFVRT